MRKERTKMAYQGYYNTTDYATLIGVTKQYVSDHSHKFQWIERYGRKWYKFDEGERAIETLGHEYPLLHKLQLAGFKSDLINSVHTESVVCRVSIVGEDLLIIELKGKKLVTITAQMGQIGAYSPDT